MKYTNILIKTIKLHNVYIYFIQYTYIYAVMIVHVYRLGVEHSAIGDTYGIQAYIGTSCSDDKVIAFRADMDALPIQGLYTHIYIYKIIYIYILMHIHYNAL